MWKGLVATGLCLCILTGCSVKTPSNLADAYTDGDIVVSLNEDRTEWRTQLLNSSFEFSKDGLTFTDLNQEKRNGSWIGNAIYVNLLGKQRTLTPVSGDLTVKKERSGRASYHLGTSKGSLVLYDDFTFTLFDDAVEGVWFVTAGHGVILASDGGRSLEQFKTNEDLLYGLVCEGSLELTPCKESVGKTTLYTLSGTVESTEGSMFSFSEDNIVLVGETAFTYTVGLDGLIRIYSSVDGMLVDCLKVEETGEVYRAVFIKDSAINPLLDTLDIDSLSEESTLESLSAPIDQSRNLVALYITAGLPAAIVSEAQKLKQLEDYQAASAQEENTEVTNFQNVIDQAIAHSVTDDALDRRVIAEVGEENMAPTGEDGDAIITLDHIAKATGDVVEGVEN